MQRKLHSYHLRNSAYLHTIYHVSLSNIQSTTEIYILIDAILRFISVHWFIVSFSLELPTNGCAKNIKEVPGSHAVANDIITTTFTEMYALMPFLRSSGIYCLLSEKVANFPILDRSHNPEIGPAILMSKVFWFWFAQPQIWKWLHNVSLLLDQLILMDWI